jgi:cell division protein FtsN
MAMARPKITSRDYKHARPNSFDWQRLRWRELGIGLAAGLVVALFVHLYHVGAANRAAEESAAASRPSAAARVAASGEISAEEEAAQSYDFYDMLPKFEVVVPEKDKEVSSERDNTLGPVERPGIYVLQAGSYRDVAEADRIRAQLKLQGIEASVQRVAVDEDVWHRVRIGPVTDLKELNRLRAKLRAADLDALVIRVGE